MIKRDACFSIRIELRRRLLHIPINKCQTKGQSFFECLQMLVGDLKKKEQIFLSATMPAFAGVHAFQTAEILLSRRTAAGGGWWVVGVGGRSAAVAVTQESV